MIILIGTEKAFYNVQHSFKIKILKNQNRSLYQFAKAIYDKTTVSIILNVQKKKALILKSIIRQRCPLSTLLFDIALETLDRSIIQEKEIKRHMDRKRRS